MEKPPIPQDNARELLQSHIAIAEELLNSIGGFRSNSQADRAFRIITIYLLAKSSCTCKALLAVVREGLPGEARILLRVLLELTVTLLYIAKAPDERALLYLNFSQMKVHEMLEKLTKSPELNAAISSVMPDMDRAVDNSYQKYKEPYLTKKGKVRRTWARIGSAEMAAEVGLDDLWGFMYQIDSALVHSGPDALRTYLNRSSDGGWEIMPDMSPEDEVGIFCQAANYLGRVTTVAASLLGREDLLPPLQELEKRRRRLDPKI